MRLRAWTIALHVCGLLWGAAATSAEHKVPPRGYSQTVSDSTTDSIPLVPLGGDAAGEEGPQVSVKIDPSSALVYGVGDSMTSAQFDRKVWGSHHGSADSLAARRLWMLGTHAGRSLKADEAVFPNVPEDQSRPGHAQVSYLRQPGVVSHIAAQINQSIGLYGVDDYQLIMALSARKWPSYMTHPGADSPLPPDVDAAAELVVEFVAAISEQSGGYLPDYFESINEPNTETFSGNETLVEIYQAAVWHHMQQRFGQRVLVGGPAYAGSDLAHNKYRALPELVYSSDQAFVSMHFFDSIWSTNASHATQYAILRNAGGHLAAVFDLVEAYTLHRFGRIIPILPSEHGLATDGSAAKHSLVPSKLVGKPLRALQVDSHWGQLMSLFDRSEHIPHLSAFLLSSGDSAWRNPSVCMGVVGQQDEVTDTAFVYELLHTLEGTIRVASQVTASVDASSQVRSQHILAHAFRRDDRLKIALKNLEDAPIVVAISFDPGCIPTQPRYAARAFINPDGTQNSSLNETVGGWQTSSSSSTVQLESSESSVIELACKGQTISDQRVGRAVTRRLRYYSGSIGVEVPTNRTVAFKVPVASMPAKCSRIVVRIGLSQDFSSNATFPYDSPAAKWIPPRMLLNGHAPSNAATRLSHDAKLKPKSWTNVWQTFEYDFAEASLSVNEASQSVVVVVGEEIQLSGLTISAVALDLYSHARARVRSPMKTTDSEMESSAPAGAWQRADRLRSLDGQETGASVRIQVGQQIAMMRPGFVSFNIDFDNRPSQLQSGFFTVNFSHPRLRTLARGLAPAAVRVGGGDEDKCIYGVGDYAPKNASSEYNPWTVRNKTAANLMLVTPERYAALAEFARSADLRLIFAFNIFYGVCCHAAFGGRCNGNYSTCRKFDVSNAEAMLSHMKSTGATPWAVQLGNEGGNGIAPLDGSTAAEAFIALDDAIARVWSSNSSSAVDIGRPNTTLPETVARTEPRQSRPIIMGPDGGNPSSYLPEFWAHLRATKREHLLAAFSYHTYGKGKLAATNGGTGWNGLRNGTVLDDWYGASYWYDELAPAGFAFNQPSSQTQLWIGESASHAGGGTPGVSNRFASLYYYLDSLAATAAANHSGFLRQDLVGASYGLIEGCAMEGKWESYNLNVSKSQTPIGTCSPNPDYFGALLFTRLMGSRVMNVSVTNSSSVRAWGHCFDTNTSTTVNATTAGGCRRSSVGNQLTLLLLNLLNGSSTVDLSQVTQIGSTAATAAAASREDYILTPSSASKAVSEPSNLLKSDLVNLNGRPLAMVGDDLPVLEGEEVTGAAVATLELPPLAAAFVVLHNCAVC